jgi:hypothetical protein
MAEESGGRDVLREWRSQMESLVSSAAGLAGRAPGADITRQLIEPMQRQLELVQEVVERQQRLQRELATRVLAPVDAVFDLLENSAVTLRKQAEALESAGAALEETAALVKGQAELFERTVGALREPTEIAKKLAGVEGKPRKAKPKPRSTAKKKR